MRTKRRAGFSVPPRVEPPSPEGLPGDRLPPLVLCHELLLPRRQRRVEAPLRDLQLPRGHPGRRLASSATPLRPWRWARGKEVMGGKAPHRPGMLQTRN